MNTRNSDVLEDFTAYCKANPTMRFWQALRNWSEQSFIIAVPLGGGLDGDMPDCYRDTFYWEHKDH